MRILLVARAMTIGGAERQFALMARGLRQRGHDVRVAVFYAGAELEAELRDAAVPIIDLGKRGRWSNFATLFRLRRVIRSFGPDVIYAILTSPNIAAFFAALGTGVPVACGIRGADFPSNAYDRVIRYSHWLETKICRYGGVRVIVNSDSGHAVMIAREVPADHIVIICNGIDTDRFRPNPAMRVTQRAALGFSPDQTLIGLVARIDPMKDHATFLRAADIMRRQRAGMTFVIVGDGPERDVARLRAQIKSLGLQQCVRMLPGRTDTERLLPIFDVVVLCSAFGEGFPNVLGEAMACGVPAVATRVGDVAAIIGEQSRLISPGDANALAGATLRVLDEPPSEGISERIARLFPVERMVAETEQALETFAARGRRYNVSVPAPQRKAIE